MEAKPVKGRPRIGAIVAAGGVGKRLQFSVHKPFVPLGERPIVTWSLKAMERSGIIREIVLVVHRSDLPRAKALIKRWGCRKVSGIVPGGATRMDSVYRGLARFSDQIDWVVVHDGARPLVTAQLIRKTVRAAIKWGAAIAALPVVPTIKEGKAGWVTRTMNRDHLWAVQTPQAFRRNLLERAHRRARAKRWKATDDAALVEALGSPVRIVMGDPKNIKVTTPEDLIVAEALLRDARRNRV